MPIGEVGRKHKPFMHEMPFCENSWRGHPRLKDCVSWIPCFEQITSDVTGSNHVHSDFIANQRLRTYSFTGFGVDSFSRFGIQGLAFTAAGYISGITSGVIKHDIGTGDFTMMCMVSLFSEPAASE